MHLQVTLGYQIRFRAVSLCIKIVQKFWVVLGLLKRAWAGLRVANHDSIPTVRCLKCCLSRCGWCDMSFYSRTVMMQNQIIAGPI